MKIKVFTSISSADYNLAYGDVTDKVSDADAKRLIERGLAQEIKATSVKKAKATKK